MARVLTHGTERSPQGRLGLGLWITAHILHTSGGRLWLAPSDASLATVRVAEFAVPTDAARAAPGLTAAQTRPTL